MAARALRLGLLVATVAILADGAIGQDVLAVAVSPTTEPSYSFPQTWINTAPPSPESLRGKGVFLFFFEELSSVCKAKWPGLMKTAREHKLDPIVFIAVNSGTAPRTVERYVREVGLNWPVIVDVDRSFERACEVGEISKKTNIYFVCYITPEGDIKHGWWDDVERTVSRALEGASWKVDPAEIPKDLQVAWRNIEFANYSAAASTLSKALTSRKKDVKEAAVKLSETVTKLAQEDLDAAQTESKNSKYRAYQRYGRIAELYDGFPAAKVAAAARRELAKDPGLRKELVQIRAVERLRPLLYSPREAAHDRAVGAIKKIIDEQPESEAARIGRELLGRQ